MGAKHRQGEGAGDGRTRGWDASFPRAGTRLAPTPHTPLVEPPRPPQALGFFIQSFKVAA